MAPLRLRRKATWRGCGDSFNPTSPSTFPRLALKQKMFRLGRAKINNYVNRESDKGGSKWLNAMSKCQYDIVMNSTGVFLRNKSSNGIWVNSNKVSKDNIWPLERYSEIFLLGSN